MAEENTPVWPADKLPLGLLSGYRYQDRPRHARTEMASGPPRIRLKSRTPVRDFYFGLLLTDGQLATFEAWVERELDGGVRWFWLPLRDGTGVSVTLVQFSKIDGPRRQGARWRLNCQCISYQRHALALSESELALLLSVEPLKLQRLSNELHHAVHRGW